MMMLMPVTMTSRICFVGCYLAVEIALVFASDLNKGENAVNVDSDTTPRASPSWGAWSEWGECTRSCGTGIATRERSCVSGENGTKADGKDFKWRFNKPVCFGLYKGIRICNTQECADPTLDVRQAHCERFNNRTIGGRQYRWKLHQTERQTCEILCKPEDYTPRFGKLGSVADDGTPCDGSDPRSDYICISGQCQRVGCDGLVGSSAQEDKCGVCAGNNTSCHIISGIFTRRNLPYGYNKIASIPKGACNVNISEMFSTKNYLAVKLSSGPYIFNGNWKMVHSGSYQGAGATFSYVYPSQDRYVVDKERIFARGPLNDSIDIMLLKQHTNLGITYEYIIPMNRSTSSQDDMYVEQTSRSSSSQQLPQVLRRADDPSASTAASQSPASSTAQSDQAFSFDQQSGYNRQRSGASRTDLDVQSESTANRDRTFSSQDTSSRYAALTGQNSGTGDQYVYLNPKESSAANYESNIPGVSAIAYSPSGPERTRNNQNRQPNADQPNTQYNTATGHRLRHRGRHGRRHITEQAPPVFIPPIPSDSQPLQVGNLNENLNPNPTRGQYVASSYPRQSYSGLSGGSTYHIIPSSRNTQSAGSQPQIPNYQAQTGRPYGYYNPAVGPQQGPQPGPYYQGQYVSPGRGPLNDQISLILPHSGRNQIGNMDSNTEYSWRISGFTECTESCGGGLQTTIIVCVKGGSQALVTAENCDNALKPQLQTVTCNNNPCPAVWEPGEWSRCSTSCGRGTQTREVGCKQKVSDAVTLDLSDTSCHKNQQAKPDAVRTCNDDVPCARWRIGNWSQCSVECGRGQLTREVVCISVENRTIPENKCDGPKPRTMELCDMGSCAKTWFHTKWSEECSADCGEGVLQRQTFCSAEPHKCSQLHRPSDTKPCKNEIPCGGYWFVGPWEKCSVLCGDGVITRDVVCLKRLGRMLAVVDDANCVAREKPEWQRECQMPRCLPEWYMSQWSECSRSCGSGYQTREVKCLDANQEPSRECVAELRPYTRQACNHQQCRINRSGAAATACEDKFKNCQVVVQARLCYYSYYKDICCASCLGHGDSPRSSDTSARGR